VGDPASQQQNVTNLQPTYPSTVDETTSWYRRANYEEIKLVFVSEI